MSYFLKSTTQAKLNFSATFCYSNNKIFIFNWECSQIVPNIPGGVFLACFRVPAKNAINHELFWPITRYENYLGKKKEYVKELMKAMCKGGSVYIVYWDIQ